MDSHADGILSTQFKTECEAHCPYYGVSDTCDASLSLLFPSTNLKRAFCDSESYDNCPIFLAKVLRRGRR